jgi:TatD DNase family protein
VIDSHCHLADEIFKPDLDEVVERAKTADVRAALVILAAGNAAEAAQARALEGIWPEVRVAIGVHPHQAHEYSADPAISAQVVRQQMAATSSARAVGEIGLDYHYDYSPPTVQRAVFRAQLNLARELRRPVVVHTREADEDTVQMLTQEGRGELRGVLHCFTGTRALAEAALDLGFYLSASGILTFPKSVELRKTFQFVPLDRLLVETDSPFLAPAPDRGRRNEPARVGRVVEVLAGIHGVGVPEMIQRTTDNFRALFQP